MLWTVRHCWPARALFTCNCYRLPRQLSLHIPGRQCMTIPRTNKMKTPTNKRQCMLTIESGPRTERKYNHFFVLDVAACYSRGWERELETVHPCNIPLSNIYFFNLLIIIHAFNVLNKLRCATPHTQNSIASNVPVVLFTTIFVLPFNQTRQRAQKASSSK
jgi:hypothetical protein